MTAVTADPTHFARAVTDLGEKRKVVAHAAIYNQQGMKIVDKGVAIDARLYERLAGHQLKAPLDECVQSENGVNGTALREAATALCADEPLLGAMLARPGLSDTLLQELALVPLPPPIAFQVTLMRETQPALWQHALRSAVVAAWLALGSGGTRHDARMLAAAGLLHDIGMLHLEPVLLQPERALSREQRRQLYTHPLVSVMLLERHHVYPRELLRAVLEHHEFCDGSGYPRNLTGAGLSPWGRMLALTEVVTAVAPRDGPAATQRLSLLLRMNHHRFDADLVAMVMPLLRTLPAADAPPPAPAGPPQPDLREIETLLNGLRDALPPVAGLPPARQQTIERVLDQAGQGLRVLADVGVTAAQMAQLEGETLDAGLRAELDLVTQEAAWQLRALARQVRRRWRLAENEIFPPALQAWLDAADALAARRLHA